MSHNTIFSKSRYNREWQTRHHHTQVFSVYVKNISDQSIYSRVSKIEKILTVRKGTINERFRFAQTWFFGEESRTPQTSKKKSFATIINSRWIKKWLLIKNRLQLLQNSPSQMESLQGFWHYLCYFKLTTNCQDVVIFSRWLMTVLFFSLLDKKK